VSEFPLQLVYTDV
jgi:hypothetical protein